VFLPWSLDPGYRKEWPKGFAMDAEESKLADLYSLDKEQIAWRRAKISSSAARNCFRRSIRSHRAKHLSALLSTASFLPGLSSGHVGKKRKPLAR
jgi:hypothetical protein